MCCSIIRGFMKYILFAFNFICWIAGILLIVLGSIIISSMGDLSEYNEVTTIPIIIIVFGSVIFLVSFLGCCGPIKENTCMTMTYSGCMVVLLIAQIALVIYVWCSKTHIINKIDSLVNTVWEERENDGRFMDALQLGVRCCGKNNPQDYFKAGGGSLPSSCCGKSSGDCEIDNAYEKGCTDAFNDYWTDSVDMVIYGGLAIAIVEAVAIVFAWCLASGYKKKQIY